MSYPKPVYRGVKAFLYADPPTQMVGKEHSDASQPYPLPARKD